jgi:hypothetical protein
MTSRLLALSFIVAALSSFAGCAANRPAAAPVCDESWNPPGELKMSFRDSEKKPGTAAPTTETQTERMKTSYRPNANDRPTRGAVHAATY